MLLGRLARSAKTPGEVAVLTVAWPAIVVPDTSVHVSDKKGLESVTCWSHDAGGWAGIFEEAVIEIMVWPAMVSFAASTDYMVVGELARNVNLR